MANACLMKQRLLTLIKLGVGGGLLTCIVACQSMNGDGLLHTQPIRFQDGIDTILESRCLECHNHVSAKESGELNLETRHSAFTTGIHAPVIVPGSPERSMLYRVLEVDDLHPVFMPPTPDRLWANELTVLRQWIADGADWPTGKQGTLVRPQDWPTP